MCYNCGYSVCNCPNVSYNSNWFNTTNCAPCSSTEVCKKAIPAKCTFYKGSNLTNLGLLTNVNIELVLFTIDQLFGSLSGETIITKSNILTALNDINDRLNVLEGASHPPYVI